MKFLNDIKTSPFVPSRARGYSYIAIFKGELADGRDKLSQRGVDPVIANGLFTGPIILAIKNVVDRHAFCDPAKL
jgi:hypothetical protein